MINIAYIYKITNKVNNKSYIGIARDRNVTLRWNEHLYSNNKLNNEIKKYGIESFMFETIEVLKNITQSELFKKEKFYIDKYDSINNGYNVISKTKSTLLTNNDVTSEVAEGFKGFQTVLYLGTFSSNMNTKLSFWKLLTSDKLSILNLIMNNNYLTRKSSKYYDSLILSFRTRQQRYFEIEEFGEKYATDNIESIINFMQTIKDGSLSIFKSAEINDNNILILLQQGDRIRRLRISCVLLYDNEITLMNEINSIFDLIS